MWLSKIRGSARSYRHPFYKLDLQPLTDDEKPLLILKIKDGDLEAAHKVVLGHLRLALGIVGRYMMVIENQTKSDDLVSAAVEGLCEGVNKIRHEGLPHTNLSGFLAEYIHRFISDYLDKFSTVRVPGRTRRRLGTEFHAPATIELNSSLIDKNLEIRLHDLEEIEVRELIDKISENDLDRKIIALRMEGHKDDAIGLQLGVSKTTVYLIRRDIEKRLLENMQ